MAELGAVFGTVFGWERPNWFAPSGYALSASDLAKPDVLLNENHPPADEGQPVRERWSFRRSNYFPFVGAECRHVTEKVGLLDMTAFAKFEVSGPGAAAWLNGLLTNAVPKTVGRLSLSYLLTANGGVRAEFTVLREAPQRLYMVSAGALERHDYDYLQKALPADGSVRLDKVTTQYGVFVVAGPRSRDLLSKLTRADLSNAAFPWLTAQTLDIGAAHVRALRVNFVGELGWELHHPIEMQTYLFDKLFEAGAEFDLKPFGIRAMDSLRLEKSYKLIPRELSIEYAALGVRPGPLRQPEKAGVLWARRRCWPGKRGVFSNAAVTLEVHGVTDADARGSEPIYFEGELVGRTTSGGFGWRVGKSLALGMVRPDLAAVGSELEVTILGERHAATVIADSPFDPGNAVLRDLATG